MLHASLWDKVKKRNVTSEMRVNTSVLVEVGIYTLVETTGLLQTVLKIGEFVSMVVSEFYCNLTRDMDNPTSENYQKVFVRGEMIEFSPRVINEHIGSIIEGKFEEIEDYGIVATELTDGEFDYWPTDP
ncbi:hypothetical protein C2S51_016366 [Perilla frutescens var. frutescens]|nr:hypothetical protein C2S51_016366 [Perilla frutescens var. frutescens]